MEQVNTLGGRYIREAKVYAKKNEDSKILMIFSFFFFDFRGQNYLEAVFFLFEERFWENLAEWINRNL